MPATSITARTGPPAITPVPRGAGFISTRPAPNAPMTSWGMVVPFRETWIKIFLGVLNPLADRVRNLGGLANAEADGAVAVADDDQRGKFEDTAALNRFGYAVNGNDLLLQVQSTIASIRAKCIPSSLELQAAFAGALRQLFDAAVINIAAAVENDLGDSLSRCAFCAIAIADLVRRFFVSANAFELFFHRRCRWPALRRLHRRSAGHRCALRSGTHSGGDSSAVPLIFATDSGVSFQPGFVSIRLFHHL